MKKKTVQMTVQVTFDEYKTDSKSIASALDRLMETATSTPGVLDEYGAVSVGEFCPPPGSVWDDDKVQFARLLTEITANVGITRADWKSLCASMDLSLVQVDALFVRAEVVWEHATKGDAK